MVGVICYSSISCLCIFYFLNHSTICLCLFQVINDVSGPFIKTLTNLSMNIKTINWSLPKRDDSYKELCLNAQYVMHLICYPIIWIIGLTGNMLSIIVLAQKKMRTSTNTYLIAMAFSDSIKLLNDFCYFWVILLLNVKSDVCNKAFL